MQQLKMRSGIPAPDARPPTPAPALFGGLKPPGAGMHAALLPYMCRNVATSGPDQSCAGSLSSHFP